MAQLMQRVGDLDAKSKEAAAEVKTTQSIAARKADSPGNLTTQSTQEKRKK